ncbi:MAG: ATP-binding protein, partial [Hyphomicrobiales bacterium]
LAASPAADSMRDELSVITKEALRARDVVRDLLFIARPAAVERTEVDVRQIIAHIERVRRAAWQQQGIEVRIETGSVTAPVWGNEHQLTQVLLNLVTNAEQALESVAERHMTIRAETAPEGLVVSVADNGPGMDPATRARVFEPFFTTKPGVGTGLGLSLSYTMVAAHHGRLEVESAPGEGTSFRMVLPHPAVLPEHAASPDKPAHQPYRVLVIDDEPNLRKVCERLIVSLGHECATAESAQAALALLEREPFDLVLCDYRLATETAEAVVQGIMSRQPSVLGRVVIATGATTDPGVVALTERHGLRLLPKPYGVEQIERLLSHRAA